MADTKWDVLTEAHDALRAAVAGVPADGWQRPTPCPEWTVTQVLQHATGDQLAYVAKLTGGPGPDYDALADPLRGFAFGQAIEPEPGAGDATALLNFLGRQADWA